MHYDAFFSHNWSQGNHEKVSRINDAMQLLGLTTWFDEERIQGNIKQQMCDGIDRARTVVFFLTENYIEKVNNVDNPEDNCQMEFLYELVVNLVRLLQ